MKKSIKNIVFLMLVAVLTLTSVMSCAAVALPELTAETAPEIVISGSAISIRTLETVQLTAEIKGTSEKPEIKWESSEQP